VRYNDDQLTNALTELGGDSNADNTPWIKALAEVRHRATREGYCYQHVQAIIVAIDQYAEAASGNRDYFLNKPYGIGGKERS
jgi:hypothetical protein